jgi:uncharacterized RDD family membrane protein YckC
VNFRKKPTQITNSQRLVSDDQTMPVAQWEGGAQTGSKSEANMLPGTEPVKFWRRLAAGLIDGTLMMVLVIGLVSLLAWPLMTYLAIPGSIVPLLNQNHIGVLIFPSFLLFFTPFFVPILYPACFEHSKLRATPGKWAMGMFVADKTGAPVSWWKTFLRVTALEIVITIVTPVFWYVFPYIVWFLVQMLPQPALTVICLLLTTITNAVLLAILLYLPVGKKKQAMGDALFGRYVFDKRSIDRKTWNEQYTELKSKPESPSVRKYATQAIFWTLGAVLAVSLLTLSYVDLQIWSHFLPADRVLSKAYEVEKKGDVAEAKALIAQARKSDMLATIPYVVLRRLDEMLAFSIKDPDPALAYKTACMADPGRRWMMESRDHRMIMFRRQIVGLSQSAERNQAIHDTILSLQDMNQKSDVKTNYLGSYGKNLDEQCTQLEELGDSKDAIAWRAKLAKENVEYKAYKKQSSANNSPPK